MLFKRHTHSIFGFKQHQITPPTTG